LLPQVQRELHAAGAPHRVIQTRDLPHATHAARDAADKGEVVVALGGDGLVGTLAGALHGSAALGVLPGGRGNDFARAIGIPQDIPGACKVLLEGVRKALDLGEANGKSFACIASVGFDSDANRIANEARFIRGNLVYAYAAIRALLAWKPARFTMRLDGREHRFEGYTVGACNTAYYGGGMKAAPDADPSDGLLDVLCLEQVSKLRFLTKVLPKVFKGEHVQEDCVTVHRAREVEIVADRPFDVYADGEPITTLPATVRLVRGGLSVIAPRPTPEPTELPAFPAEEMPAS
jgi:YegS/Rv2252/BmrU family lipid kinase